MTVWCAVLGCGIVCPHFTKNKNGNGESGFGVLMDIHCNASAHTVEQPWTQHFLAAPYFQKISYPSHPSCLTRRLLN